MARRWFALVNEFTGGDRGIAQSLRTMYENEEQVNGVAVASLQPMFEFVRKAAAAAGIEIPWL